MLPLTPAAPPALTGPCRFCRACGYDLRASTDRCPDCGRAFDAAKARTFARTPPRALFRWLWRAAYLAAVVVLLLVATVVWLRRGWSEDQRHVAALRERITPSTDLEVTWDSINPWLTSHLPSRLGLYLRRVVKVDLYCENVTERDFQEVGEFGSLRELMVGGPRITDADVAHLKGLSRLERLELFGGAFTDVGIENLKGLRQLEDLTIQGGKMTNKGLDGPVERRGNPSAISGWPPLKIAGILLGDEPCLAGVGAMRSCAAREVNH